MKKQIKSYTVLLPELYRWGMLLVLPAVLIAANAALAGVLGYMSVVMCMWIYSFLDIFLDYWVFGGICSKEGGKMAYIKSSQYGYRMLKNGLIGDEVRRFCGMAVTAFGAFGYFLIFRWRQIAAADMLFAWILVFVPFFINTALLNLSRYIEVLVMHNLVSCLASGISFGFLVSMGEKLYSEGSTAANAIRLGVVLAVVLALSAIAAAGTIWHMLSRVKQSYWDSCPRGLCGRKGVHQR